MTQQTAVEWLQECLDLHLTHEQKMQYEGLFQQSKQMEKEQMGNMFFVGGQQGYLSCEGKPFETFEKYYKETYGGQGSSDIPNTQKQITMKLYTEEQVKRAYHEGYWNGFNEEETCMDKCIKSLTPIELPSDEEIINKFNAFITTEVALKFLTKEQGERLKWYYQTYLVDGLYDENK